MSRLLLAGLRWLTALIVVTTFGSGFGLADEWTAYRMGDVTFEAPADWKVARQQRDRTFVLQNPKRDLELSVQWWFQDEPILGYDDIKSHKRVKVAGKPATYIHSVFPNRQTLKVVLDEKRPDGRKLLLVLESTATGLSAISPLFDDLLARVRFGKSSAVSSDRPMVGKQAAQQQAEKTQAGQQPSGQTPVGAAGADTAVLHDAAGQFALRYPAGWRKGVTERDGTRIVTLSSPDGKALILVAVLTGTPERDLKGRVEDFESFYYDNSVLPDSIEGDGDLRIGTLDGRYADMIAQIHPVEGVRLAFSEGRAWLFKSIDDDRAYIAAFLHARSAPAALQATLNDSVKSLRTGVDAAAMLQSGPALPVVAPGQKQTPLSPQMRAVAGHIANDCGTVALATWNHPTLEVIRKRKQANLVWAMLCRNRSYPVYGINFDYDPQGRTSDFFNPLYDEMLSRNRDAPFSFAVLRDKLIVDVTRPAKDGLSVNIREVPELDDAPADRGGGVNPHGVEAKPGSRQVTAAPERPVAGAAVSATQPYLPAPEDEEEVRVWLGPVSFEPPSGWQLQPDNSGHLMAMVRPDPGAEILVILWPAERPMPSTGITRIEHVVIAGAPATRLREKSGRIDIDHIFLDEPFADGSRLSVAYRATGEPPEDGAPLFELVLASLDRKRPAPGGPTQWMSKDASAVDPFANLDTDELELKPRK
ncbi:MAG: hypothetical protein Q8M24_26415 [Pseudolabrys sp.]|nr:hypothetical protein [Pseudolabrys sp.]MDP2298990.1 hypothetical protein [Pseudolabrys sp.]